MVLPPNKRQKAQKWLGLDVQAIFSQSLRVQQVAPTSLYKRGKKVYLFYSARFIRFIDSLKDCCVDSNLFNYLYALSVFKRI